MKKLLSLLAVAPLTLTACGGSADPFKDRKALFNKTDFIEEIDLIETSSRTICDDSFNAHAGVTNVYSTLGRIEKVILGTAGNTVDEVKIANEWTLSAVPWGTEFAVKLDDDSGKTMYMASHMNNEANPDDYIVQYYGFSLDENGEETGLFSWWLSENSIQYYEVMHVEENEAFPLRSYSIKQEGDLLYFAEVVHNDAFFSVNGSTGWESSSWLMDVEKQETTAGGEDCYTNKDEITASKDIIDDLRFEDIASYYGDFATDYPDEELEMPELNGMTWEKIADQFK